MADLQDFVNEIGALPAEARTLLPHEALAGREVIVTGASGFVGQWVLGAIGWLNAQATHAPIRVRAMSRRGVPVDSSRSWGVPTWCRWEQVDVCRPPVLHGAVAVLHAALPSTATPAGEENLRRTIAIEGTMAMIRAALDARIPRVLLLSSGAVYAPTGEVSTETDTLDVSTPDLYARDKMDAEDQAMALVSGTPLALCIARLFTAYGIGYAAHDHLAHATLLKAASRREPLQLSGDGQPLRSYLYGADLAVWLLVLMMHGSGIYNVGHPEPCSVRRFAETTASVLPAWQTDVRTGIGPMPRRAVYVPDVTRAMQRHHLQVWTPLSEGIRRTVDLLAIPGAVT